MPNRPAPPPSPLLAVYGPGSTCGVGAASLSTLRLGPTRLQSSNVEQQVLVPDARLPRYPSHLPRRVVLPEQGALERPSALQAGLHFVEGGLEIGISVLLRTKLLNDQRLAQGGGVCKDNSTPHH